jgi:hypothetical protein
MSLGIGKKGSIKLKEKPVLILILLLIEHLFQLGKKLYCTICQQKIKNSRFLDIYGPRNADLVMPSALLR